MRSASVALCCDAERVASGRGAGPAAAAVDASASVGGSEGVFGSDAADPRNAPPELIELHEPPSLPEEAWRGCEGRRAALCMVAGVRECGP